MPCTAKPGSRLFSAAVPQVPAAAACRAAGRPRWPRQTTGPKGVDRVRQTGLRIRVVTTSTGGQVTGSRRWQPVSSAARSRTGWPPRLQLSPAVLVGASTPGEKPQARFYRRAASPGQCQQQRRRTQVDRQICRIRHAGAGAGMTRRTAPPAQCSAPRTSRPPSPARRLLRQLNAAAVMPSAVCGVRDLTVRRLLGRRTKSVPRRRQCAARQHRANGARWPLSAPAASSRRYAVRKFVSSSTSDTPPF